MLQPRIPQFVYNGHTLQYKMSVTKWVWRIWRQNESVWLRIYWIGRKLLADHLRKRRNAHPATFSAMSEQVSDDCHALIFFLEISLPSVAWDDKVLINAIQFPSNSSMSTNKLYNKDFWDVITCPWVSGYKSSRRHIPKDLNLHPHRSESKQPRKSTAVIPALKTEYQTVLCILLMWQTMYK
jgi:hypothetical protein